MSKSRRQVGIIKFVIQDACNTPCAARCLLGYQHTTVWGGVQPLLHVHAGQVALEATGVRSGRDW